MKWLISTCCSLQYSELGDITSKINREYAFRHGYEFNIHYAYPGTNFGNSVYANVYLIYIKEILKYYDAVCTIDADAMFMNHTIKLDDVFSAGFDQQIAIEEIGGSAHNNGVIFWRNSCSTIELINSILNTQGIIDHIFNWQGYLSTMLLGNDPCVSRMKVVSSHVMNSFGCNQNAKEFWKDGDFIIHFFMAPLSTKIELAKKYIEKVKR